MRFHKITVLGMLSLLFQSGLIMPSGAADGLSQVRIGGWIGNDPILVLPDRSAGAATEGAFAGVRIAEIGNNSYTLEKSGQQVKITLDPSWFLAPHPDLTNWLISYMKAVGLRLDAQVPDLTQSTIIKIGKNGLAKSTFIKVEQACPFQTLPDWLESIDLQISLNPHETTKVRFVSMTVSTEAYAKLLKDRFGKDGTINY